MLINEKTSMNNFHLHHFKLIIKVLKTYIHNLIIINLKNTTINKKSFSQTKINIQSYINNYQSKIKVAIVFKFIIIPNKCYL